MLRSTHRPAAVRADRPVRPARTLAAALLLGAALTACSAPDGVTGPPPTPNPEPAPGPAPAPQPVTTQLARADGGGTSFQRGSAFTGTYAGFNRSQHAGRMYAEAIMGLAINERPAATSYVYNNVKGKPGRYTVMADLRWRGNVYGIGVAGTGARATLVARVTDGRGNTVASQTVLSAEYRDAALAAGGKQITGSKSVQLAFTLPANVGDSFQIRFDLTCQTYSGFLSAETGCLFGNGGVAAALKFDGYAEWTKLAVRHEPTA
jgi:hypothetical protein